MSATPYRTADQPSVADVVTAASRITKLSEDDLLGRSRMMHIVRVRNAVCLVAHEMGHSYSAIGRELGKDHTTIIHAVEQASDLTAERKLYRQLVNDIRMLAGRIHASRALVLT